MSLSKVAEILEDLGGSFNNHHAVFLQKYQLSDFSDFYFVSKDTSGNLIYLKRYYTGAVCGHLVDLHGKDRSKWGQTEVPLLQHGKG